MYQTFFLFLFRSIIFKPFIKVYLVPGNCNHSVHIFFFSLIAGLNSERFGERCATPNEVTTLKVTRVLTRAELFQISRYNCLKYNDSGISLPL